MSQRASEQLITAHFLIGLFLFCFTSVWNTKVFTFLEFIRDKPRAKTEELAVNWDIYCSILESWLIFIKRRGIYSSRENEKIYFLGSDCVKAHQARGVELLCQFQENHNYSATRQSDARHSAKTEPRSRSQHWGVTYHSSGVTPPGSMIGRRNIFPTSHFYLHVITCSHTTFHWFPCVFEEGDAACLQ